MWQAHSSDQETEHKYWWLTNPSENGTAEIDPVNYYVTNNNEFRKININVSYIRT